MPDKILRIVVAYPGDAAPYKDRVKPTVDSVNHLFSTLYASIKHAGLNLAFQVSSWDTDSYPGLDQHGAQGRIDECLRIEDADVLVAIFANRLGRPHGDGKTNTEHEIAVATAAWQAKGSPQVMLYFKEQSDSLSNFEDAKEWARLLQFREAWPYLRATFQDEVEFEKKLLQHLTKFGLSIMEKANAPVTSAVHGAKSQLECVFSSEVRIVRSEGVTERIGDIWIHVAGFKPSDAERLVGYVDILCYLNTNVTNHGDDGSTDAFVIPIEAGQGMISIVSGRPVSGRTDALLFRNVPLCGPRSGSGISRLRISNIRAYAAGLGTTTNPISCYVILSQSALSPHLKLQSSGGVIAATTSHGLEFVIQRFSEEVRFARRPEHQFRRADERDEPVTNRPDNRWHFILNFRPCFAGAFTSAQEEANLIPESRHINATSFAARFHNIPDNARIFLSASDLRPEGQKPRVAVRRGFLRTSPNPDGLIEADFRGSTGEVVWEFLGDDSTMRQGEIRIGGLVEFSGSPPPSISGATCFGSFYPISTLFTCGPWQIPRFVDSSKQTLIF